MASSLGKGGSTFDNDFLRVPVESLNRNFRLTQRYVEKHLISISKTTKKFSSTGSKKDTDDLCARLQQIVDRTETVRRKLGNYQAGEEKCLTTIEKRVRYMKTKSPETIDIGLTRMICNHLLQTGRAKAATILAKKNGLLDLVDEDLWRQCHEVCDALLGRHDCAPALEWCTQNASQLRKFSSRLPFELRVQTFLEMVRAAGSGAGVSNKQAGAVKYARKHLPEWLTRSACESEDDFAYRVALSRAAMTTLLFVEGKRGSVKRYGALFSEDRWRNLRSLFLREMRRVYGMSRHSALKRTIEAGVAALQSRRCGKVRRRECPTCHEHFGVLAKRTPAFRQTQSRLVCRISGVLMDETNPPMALPNGHVYSRRALEEIAAKRGDDRVVCPTTGKEFPLSSLSRVFVM